MVNWGDVIAYGIIIIVIITIYLKKTNQTFAELIRKIIDGFRGIGEEIDE